MTPTAPEEQEFAPFADGFHPFWFWNDRITAGGIRRQVASMAEQGVKGFFVHSRQGLEQPYLSSEFLDLVELAVEEAKAHGLAVHLYDEYPYPSGAAGGAVVQSDPSLAGTDLVVTMERLPAGPVRVALPPGRLLACVVVPAPGDAPDWGRAADVRETAGMSLTRESYYSAGLGSYNDRRFFADTPAPVLETTLGETSELWAVSSVAVTAHKYWGHFPDVTDPRAVQRFIELTHERYRRRLGPVLRQVASVFVDEVEPVVSSSVVAELERRHGERSSDMLLAYAAPSHPGHLRARREVEEVRKLLFEVSFEQPVSRWCRENGVRYAGEKPSTRLAQLRWMDVPGCEPGHTKAGASHHDLLQPDIRGNAKATASAAYLYGKEGSLCECFHSMGWGATLQDAKLIAESLLLLGIRWLVPHAFFYSTRGLRKHDAPPSFFQMPYWRLFGALSDRVGAISQAFAGTVIDAAVGVVEPSGGLPSPEQLSCYEDLQHQLMAAHLDFVTVDTDILEAGELVEGAVAVRDLRLRAIVVPPVQDRERALEDWLGRFEARSGVVVRVDDPCAVGQAVEEVARMCPPALEIRSGDGGDAGVLSVSRRGDRGHRYLLVNTAGRPVDLELRPRKGGDLAVRPLERPPAPALELLSRGRFGLHLEAFESVLLGEDGTDLRKSGPLGEAAPLSVRIPTEGRWRARPLGPNFLRLGRWRMSLFDGKSLTAVVEPAPIINQLLHAGLPFVPSVKERFGAKPLLALPELRVRYEAAFESAVDVPLQLVMEPGALAGDWAASFDGGPPFGRQEFAPVPGPVEGCVGFEVVPTAGGMAEGSPRFHKLVVDVTVRDGEEGLRDSLYIAGDFAVWAPPASPRGHRTSVPVLARIGAPPKDVVFGALEEAGLPYFAGVVEYERATELPQPAGTDLVLVELELPAYFEDALEVAFGEECFHPLPWSPRRALLPGAQLPGAATRVRIRQLTTLVRVFEGRWFDPATHAYREVELAPSPA